MSLLSINTVFERGDWSFLSEKLRTICRRGVAASAGLGDAWRPSPDSPLILGHRGASAHFPENTVAAFQGALDAGADGVELDVRLCASGELMVFHDEDLRRLCGVSRRVSNICYRELRAFDVGGEAIPTLEDVLAALPSALVNIELKPVPLAHGWPLVRECIRVVARRQAQTRVLVSSFDPRFLLMLRALNPHLARASLVARQQPPSLRREFVATLAAPAALHPEHVLVTQESTRHWQAGGVRVHPWTVDDPQRIVALARMGVEAIICNDPGAAIRALEAASIRR